MPEEITPIRQQYLDIKKKYPDTIVFFRLGDFYETFDGDAETTSRELDIVLTGRNVAKGNRVPMAGIPFHALDNYLVRLINKGYHVAIVEQVGEQPVRGLFPREVVRIVTPGTVTEPTLLSSERNNYLFSCIIQDHSAGLAYVDISTGEFQVTQLDTDDIHAALKAEISRIAPAEVLVSDQQAQMIVYPGHTTPWQHWHFESARCRQTLLSHFNVITLDAFGIQQMPLAERAAGALIQYVNETQPGASSQLSTISTYSQNDFMMLDSSTRRNLELTSTIRNNTREGSLLGVIDLCITPMGHRLISKWINQPLLDIQEINHRLDGVEFFSRDGILRAEFRTKLRNLADFERILSRIGIGSAGPRDLIALRDSLRIFPELMTLLEGLHLKYPKYENLDECSDIQQIITESILDDPASTIQSVGIIRSGYSSELDGIVESSRHAREWIAGLENVEKTRTNIKTLKVGFNKVFGYYIEVTQVNSSQVPENYIRKQTLVNAERYITPELKEYEALVLNAETRIHEIETRLFKEILHRLNDHASALLKVSHLLAQYDVLAALAEIGVRQNYHRPNLTDDLIVDIKDGRHPVVEMDVRGGQFVPNDYSAEPGELIRIITGPNMSGKSTYLRQTALIVLMAQMGCFIPAASATIGLVDRIFTRIGAQDEIHSGQSTFMVEMVETAYILHHASNRSLLILDEIGRGTSTYDGLSIAWAVIEYIHNHPRLRSRTLFATHFHEMIQLANTFPGVRNYNVAVIETGDSVLFLHKIVPGGADRSYGIHVAQLAGIPGTVI